LNGIFYECFPNNPWWQSDRTGFLIFLENQREGYLSTAKGRTWSIVYDQYASLHDGNLFCLISSLIGGCLYTEARTTAKFSGWTLDIDSGAPLGELSIEGSMDSTLTVKRALEKGEARISFNSWETRRSWAFTPQ
jgi:hypothetical protein